MSRGYSPFDIDSITSDCKPNSLYLTTLLSNLFVIALFLGENFSLITFEAKFRSCSTGSLKGISLSLHFTFSHSFLSLSDKPIEYASKF